MYEFPFTEESVPRDFPNEVVFGYLRAQNKFEFAGQIVFGEDGQTGHDIWHRWRVRDGVLCLCDKEFRRDSFVFDGLILVNGSVALSGHLSVCLESRVLMYPRISMKERGCGILVSTHVDYLEIAVPRLLRSLASVGVSPERIRVVVAGAKEDQTLDDVECLAVPDRQDLWGYVGLMKATDDYPYWLLLHDTCEATQVFMDNLNDLDVGLNYDIVTMGANGIGVYSWDYLQGLSLEGNAIDVGRRLGMSSALERIVVHGADKVLTAGKDVYGTGQRRKVIEYACGLRKYERDMNAKATP